MSFNAQQRVIRSIGYYHNLKTRPSSPYRQDMTVLMNQTGHHAGEIKRLPTLNTNPHHLAVETERQRLQDTPTTYDRTWTIEQAKPDQSMDQGGGPQHEKTTIRPSAIGTTSPGLKTAYRLHPNRVVTTPSTEAPHTPYASPMR